MHDTTTTYDAIVAGAGPTGLFLACELALAGCMVLVLERASEPHAPLKALPFGIRGLNAPTIDALHRRGLLDMLEAPRRLHNPFATQHAGRKPAGHFSGIAFHEEDIDRTQWPWRTKHGPPASLLAELAELETVLAGRAEALGVRIVRGHAVDVIEQHADRVTVCANGTAFEAGWLVGCDGARSAVRKQCGIAFDGTEPEFTGYTARLTLTEPDALPFGRHATARGMYFQSQPGYFGIQDFDGGAFHDSGEPVTREHLQDVMRRVCGKDVTIEALHYVTTWTDRARQAATYRSGRVVLAGDAAHIHSPLGGQGLNLGIGDAMNLGWKLAATIRGEAPAGLLDTYQAERHPVAAQVLDWSRAQVALMRPAPGERALYAILRDLVNTRDGSTYVAGRVWGVNLRYELGDAHPLVGRSVPELVLDDGTTVGRALRGGGGLLVDVGIDPALDECAKRYRGLRYVRALPEAGIDVPALLVRPDGIVAWAGGAAALDDATARWFVPG